MKMSFLLVRAYILGCHKHPATGSDIPSSLGQQMAKIQLLDAGLTSWMLQAYRIFHPQNGAYSTLEWRPRCHVGIEALYAHQSEAWGEILTFCCRSTWQEGENMWVTNIVTKIHHHACKRHPAAQKPHKAHRSKWIQMSSESQSPVWQLGVQTS